MAESDRCNYIESLSGIETWLPDLAPCAAPGVATILNPYQGLKRFHPIETTVSSFVATILNPYQGLKQGNVQLLGKDNLSRCNYIESLSGIETSNKCWIYQPYTASCNYIESLSGIETSQTIHYQYP